MIKGAGGLIGLGMLMMMAFAIGAICRELETGIYIARDNQRIVAATSLSRYTICSMQSYCLLYLVPPGGHGVLCFLSQFPWRLPHGFVFASRHRCVAAGRECSETTVPPSPIPLLSLLWRQPQTT